MKYILERNELNESDHLGFYLYPDRKSTKKDSLIKEHGKSLLRIGINTYDQGCRQWSRADSKTFQTAYKKKPYAKHFQAYNEIENLTNFNPEKQEFSIWNKKNHNISFTTMDDYVYAICKPERWIIFSTAYFIGSLDKLENLDKFYKIINKNTYDKNTWVQYNSPVSDTATSYNKKLLKTVFASDLPIGFTLTELGLELKWDDAPRGEMEYLLYATESGSVFIKSLDANINGSSSALLGNIFDIKNIIKAIRILIT